MNTVQSIEADAAQTKNFRFYDVVSVCFVAIYLISQVASTKLFAFGPFQFPGAIIVFPISYIFGDILCEVYGYSKTRRIIWLGFISATVMALVFLAVQALPPAAMWPHQEAYEKILGFVPRVVLGSIGAFWCGEFANSFVMAKLKVITQGKHLWARTIGSTVIGQAVDSAVFVVIAFSGLMPASVILSVTVSIYVAKVAYEVIATPITYIIVNRLKRAEGVDVFDKGTNFTPFKF